MNKDFDKKTYYLIVLPAVLIIVLVFTVPVFPYRIQFGFFIVLLSLVAFFFVDYFKRHPEEEDIEEDDDHE